MNGDHQSRPVAAPSPAVAPEDWPLDVQRTDASGEVDLEQLEYQLSLTPAQRLEANDQWARFMDIVREAGRSFREKRTAHS